MRSSYQGADCPTHLGRPISALEPILLTPRRSVNDSVNQSSGWLGNEKRLHAHRASRCDHHPRHPAGDRGAVVPLLPRPGEQLGRQGERAQQTILRAVEAYNADNSKGYSGLDLTDMKSYDQGVKNVVILGTSNTVSYCLRSSVGTKSWYKQGPGGDITTTAWTMQGPGRQLNSKRARETAPFSLPGRRPAAERREGSCGVVAHPRRRFHAARLFPFGLRPDRGVVGMSTWSASCWRSRTRPRCSSRTSTSTRRSRTSSRPRGGRRSAATPRASPPSSSRSSPRRSGSSTTRASRCG